MQVLKRMKARRRPPDGELIFWRCCVAQPVLMLIAVVASALMIVMAGIAACSFTLDAWRRDG